MSGIFRSLLKKGDRSRDERKGYILYECNENRIAGYTSVTASIFFQCGGSLILSLLLLVTGTLYVQIYRVEPAVSMAARQILLAFAVIAPVKVQNMILGGGIIRSGGKTNFVMWIDLIGTWGFGVPLGLLAVFVWNMSIPWVYFILSLEECVRLGISLIIFRKRSWMRMI